LANAPRNRPKGVLAYAHMTGVDTGEASELLPLKGAMGKSLLSLSFRTNNRKILRSLVWV